MMMIHFLLITLIFYTTKAWVVADVPGSQNKQVTGPTAHNPTTIHVSEKVVILVMGSPVGKYENMGVADQWRDVMNNGATVNNQHVQDDITNTPHSAVHKINTGGTTSAVPIMAHGEYKNIMDEFDAVQIYNNLLADYQYDGAVEEARENRAVSRLKGEKREVLRAKKKKITAKRYHS